MAIDVTKAFEADQGFKIIDQAGVFSDASAPNYDCALGSIHLQTSNGKVYRKITAGTGTETWSEMDQVAGANVFGSEYSYSEDNSTSTTSSPTFVQKLRHTFTATSGRTYRIAWSAEVRHTDGGGRAGFQVQINDSTTINRGEYQPGGNTQTNGFVAMSGIYHTNALNGTVNIDVDYADGGASASASIRNARVEVWRVA